MRISLAIKEAEQAFGASRTEQHRDDLLAADKVAR
jgi:hypothetical protein